MTTGVVTHPGTQRDPEQDSEEPEVLGMHSVIYPANAQPAPNPPGLGSMAASKTLWPALVTFAVSSSLLLLL